MFFFVSIIARLKLRPRQLVDLLLGQGPFGLCIAAVNAESLDALACMACMVSCVHYYHALH